jgi:dTDP-4-dehydrorhamnose reductase
MRILITGAAGQLGREIVRRLSAAHDVQPFGRADLDLTRHDDVVRTVRERRPEVVVNCAAYNGVDAAEDQPVEALKVNAFGVASLARAAAEAGATLVHYSTDFVFDGQASRPYEETDQPTPRGVYAVSKLLGEWLARDAGRWLVLRVESLFGGSPAKSSVDRIVDAILEGREAPVFTDRTVSPSYVTDVAWATERLVAAGATGLYHCVNSGFTTWYGLAQEAARLLGREATLVPVSVADVPLRAPRPQFAALSNERLARAGIDMPSWQDALARHLEARVRAR